MSALTGSLSYARFFIEKELPNIFSPRGEAATSMSKAHEAIVSFAMRPLNPDEPDTERSGWCVMGEALDVSMPHERVFLDGYINLGFRTDKWAIPGPLLKTKVREAEAAYKERSGRDRLGKREKSEIKEVVTRELRKKLVPSTRVIDLTWSLEEGLIRFFSHSERVTNAMAELFEKTFKLPLTHESPFTLSQRLGLTDAEIRAWENLEVTVLASEGAR